MAMAARRRCVRCAGHEGPIESKQAAGIASVSHRGEDALASRGGGAQSAVRAMRQRGHGGEAAFRLVRSSAAKMTRPMSTKETR
jgi:hypothetical protein